MSHDSLRGKTALVTGSTDGLGRAVALEIAAIGASVIVHGRNRRRGQDVVERIRAAGGTAVFYEADMASLDAVRGLADRVRERHDALHLLVNNAGIWVKAGDASRHISADGHELIFAVNYLSGFLLTHLLLPLLRSHAPARVVNVSSVAQTPIEFDDVMLTREYSGSRAYHQSKLAQILFTFDLARELEESGVTVNSLHPAMLMDTTMVREARRRPLTTVDEGAAAVMQLAAGPLLEGRTGLYFDGLTEGHPHAQAYDEEARTKLRALSMRLSGLQES